MGSVVLGTTMSVDGFIADRNGDSSILYPDLENLRHTDMLKESIARTGAVVMGRRAYDMAAGDFTGYEYQVPIFVVTHHVPQTAIKGENDNLTVTFVTAGVESAVQMAQSAAGDKDVTVIGGASTAQQCLQAGLVDELQIGIFPILLGDGLRFFDDDIGGEATRFEKLGVMETETRTDIRYRVLT